MDLSFWLLLASPPAMGDDSPRRAVRRTPQGRTAAGRGQRGSAVCSGRGASRKLLAAVPLDPERNGRWKRRVAIGWAVFCASTLLPTYLSFQAWAISPDFRGPLFARRMWLLYLLTFWLWTATAP